MTPTGYQTSSYCHSGGCVAVRVYPSGYAHIRGTNHPAQPPLVFTPDEWAAFIAGVKNGEFDPSGGD